MVRPCRRNRGGARADWPDGKIKKVTVPIIMKRLEKGDETIEVTFPMLDVLR